MSHQTMTPVFIRRLGAKSSMSGPSCASLKNCPDILELSDGFAVIGTDITEKSEGRLPPDVGCGPGERIVWIPRSILVRARAEIPTE